LGLCPKPRRGSLELLPQTLQLVLRSATSKGKKGRGREGKMEAKEMCKKEVEGEGVDIAWLDL